MEKLDVGKNIPLLSTPLVSSIVDTWIKPKLQDFHKNENLNEGLCKKVLVAFEDFLKMGYEKNKVVNNNAVKNKTKSIMDIYVPLTLKSANGIEEVLMDSYKENFINEIKNLVITGPPVTGKTTLLKWLYIDSMRRNKGVPILIECRKLSHKNKVIDEIVNQFNPVEKELVRNFIFEFIKRGDFIFFLDGYDEINTNYKNSFTEDLQNLIFKASNNIFIVSSRPDLALDSSFNNFNIFDIKDLSGKQKLEFKEKNVDIKMIDKWANYYFNDDVPKTGLYHYTSLNAAKSILDTKEIWLSNVRTMNDPDELSYGYRLITEALKEIEKKGLTSHKSSLNKLIEVMKHLEEQKVVVGNAEIYLTCFSETNNTIRQWITYGDSASGVSVRFANSLNKKKHQIEGLLRNRAYREDQNLNQVVISSTEISPDIQETIELYTENFYGFKKVIYVDELNSSSFIKDLVVQLSEPINDLLSDIENNDKLHTTRPADYVQSICNGTCSISATNFFIKMALVALSVKHHHWKDEEEWRLMLLLHSSKVNNYNTHFLIKPGMIVPFIKYFITPNDLSEIWLGPKTNETMNRLALDYYLKANPVYNGLKIKKSEIKMAF